MQLVTDMTIIGCRGFGLESRDGILRSCLRKPYDLSNFSVLIEDHHYSPPEAHHSAVFAIALLIIDGSCF